MAQGAEPAGIAAGGVIDSGRLARALYLAAEPIGPGRWRITGGAAPHTVKRELGGLRCDCPDAYYAGPCKHALRVELMALEPGLLEVLRLLVPAPRARRAAA